MEPTDYKSIYRHLESLPVFSDHSHHREDAQFAPPFTLEKALSISYVAWLGHPLDGTPERRRALLDHARHNTYLIWFEKGLQRVHGLTEPLTVENWDAVSDTLSRAYAADPDFHWQALRAHGFERAILDSFWNPGDDVGHPELFTPTFRIDQFMYAYHAEADGPNGIRPWAHYGIAPRTLGELVACMQTIIRARRQQGKVAAFKCAEAYNRDITFQPDDAEAAARVFGRHPREVTRAEWRLFGNYIFNRCCELAAELDVPFQIHTGLARLDGSQPVNFEDTLARHPRTRFVLFHSGYPWIHQAAGLAHNYANVLPSLTWTATISTTAAIRALHEFLDVGRSVNDITWGDDCACAEEAVGALLAWRHIVATVIAERLAGGLLHAHDADLLAEKLLFRNGRRVYGNGGPRS